MRFPKAGLGNGRTMRALACALVASTSAGVSGCHGKDPDVPVGASRAAAGPKASGLPLKPPKAKASLIATIGDRAVGPYLARRDDSAMAAYLAFGEDGVRRVSVVPLTPEGDLKSGVRSLVPTPFDSADLAISATHGENGGYAVVFSALTDRGKGLWGFGVTEDGQLRGQASEITRTTNDLVWNDVVPTNRGALAVWVEQTADGDGILHAAALDEAGKLRGVPVRVLKGVAGWQVVATEDRVQIAVVHSHPGLPREEPSEKSDKADPSKKQAPPVPQVPTPAISLLTLDADARTERAVPVAPSAAVRGAIEVARERGRTHVAWTDTRAQEPEVLEVTVDDTKGALPARRVADTRDGTSLVALGAGPTGAVVAWERDVPESRGHRYVQVARLSDPLGNGAPRKATRIEVLPKSKLEVASTPDGFAVLGAMRPCGFDPKASPDCPAEPFVPSLLRTDADLAPLDVAPLEFGEDKPGFGWSLGCPGGCLALAASAEAPSHVRTAFVPRRSAGDTKTLRESPEVAKEATRLLEVETLSTGEAIAHLAKLRLGDHTLIASLSSDFDVPGKQNRSAILRVRAFDDQGKSLDEPPTKTKDPSVVTNRALSIGGLALAPAGKPEDGGAVAWVAREGGDPEVHVTRLDARGHRTNDIVLTSAKGDATDVALAWVGNAWIVAWVDFRNGNGEVYATKITPDLRRIVREERLTNAPGDASGLRLVPFGRDRVLAAWADAREAPREGFADIYVAQIRAHDATLVAPEVRIVPSVPHSRSPELALTGDGAVVAWIEQAPEGADASGDGAYRALVARLDAQGKPFGVPATLPMAGPGHPTAITLDANERGLRGVLARTRGQGMTLDGFMGNFGTFSAFQIGSIATPSSSDVALLGFGDWLFFGEDGASPGERRLRRARVLAPSPDPFIKRPK